MTNSIEGQPLIHLARKRRGKATFHLAIVTETTQVNESELEDVVCKFDIH